jgi:multicomponent Na+:H+ antiporter subunit B
VSSLILRTATQFQIALLLLFSVFLLLRGHDAPGGGFVGGLVASAAFVLSALADGVAHARRLLRVDPRALVGVGLLVAAGSGALGLAAGRPFLTGLWVEIAGGPFGTPLLFDAGVYLVVVGVTLTIILSLAEE